MTWHSKLRAQLGCAVTISANLTDFDRRTNGFQICVSFLKSRSIVTLDNERDGVWCFSSFNSCRRFLELNTTLRALQTLKTLIRFDCAVSSEQKIITYFDVLRYIASFKGAELQFSPVLFGVHKKLLFDLTKLKLET